MWEKGGGGVGWEQFEIESRWAPECLLVNRCGSEAC